MMSLIIFRTLALFVLVISVQSMPKKRAADEQLELPGPNGIFETSGKEQEFENPVADGIAENIGKEQEFENPVADGIAENIGTLGEETDVPKEKIEEELEMTVTDGNPDSIGEGEIFENPVADGIPEDIGKEQEFENPVADGIAENIGELQEEKSVMKRKKRMTAGRAWPGATVPTRLSDGLSAEQIKSTVYAKSMYERFSCLRFPNYTAENGASGFITFVTGDGCEAAIGFQGAEIRLTCCTGWTCLHELGHTLGAMHENQNKKGKAETRINLNNVRGAWRGNYQMVDGESTGYDSQSVMHYSKYLFAEPGKETMTILNSLTKKLGGEEYYYLIQELSLKHKCGETKCSGVTDNCINDGYLTQVDGKCECRCPQGLDPTDGCKSVLGKASGGKWYDQRPWPAGKWALPKTKDDCPSGFPNFKDGELIMPAVGGYCQDHPTSHCSFWNGIEQYNCKNYPLMKENCTETCGFCEEENLSSPGYALGGEVLSDEQVDQFCVSDGSAGTPSNLAAGQELKWPSGQYCIYRKGGSCPSGFQEGSIFVKDEDEFGSDFDGELPDGEFEDYSGVTFQYCCRNDGFITDPLLLPPTGSFALITYKTTQCHTVLGMHVKSGWKRVQITESAHMKGMHPAQLFSRSMNSYTINHCTYTPAKMDCGGTIELTPNAASSEFDAPSFTGAQCNWLFKGPEGTKLKIDFPTFDVKTGDQIGLRFNRLGQNPYPYSGSSFERPVITFHNTLMVSYVGSSSSFKGKVTLLHDGNMCYKVSDKGESYRETHAKTALQKPCVSWSSVQGKCNYSPSTHPNAGLDSNYCRNPGGDGMAPWCYTSVDKCERDYCEPCNVSK